MVPSEANDLADGNLNAAGLSLWEALSFGAASNAGMVQGLYEQGQITDGEFYQGLLIAGAQSGAKATVTLLPAAKVPGLLSGANVLLTSAKVGVVYGAAEASVEVIGDRAMEDVLRLSSDRTIWGGGTKYVATQTGIGAGSGLAFGGITKGLQKVREAWNKSVIPDGPFFLAPDAAPAPKTRTAILDELFSNSQFWKKGEFRGTRVYQRNDLINPNLIDARGRTNLQRMQDGLAPIGPDGKSINLHHTIQSADSPLAEVSATFHQQNSSVIHINPNTIPSGIDRKLFDAFRRDYWINRANDFLQ